MGRKRKSGNSESDKEASKSNKRRSTDQETTEQRLTSTEIELQEGEASAQGYCFSPDSAHLEQTSEPVQLTSSAQVGGPLQIRAVARHENTQIPLSADRHASLRLSECNESADSSASSILRAKQFQVLRSTEEDAPQYRSPPELWQLAAQSIAEAAGTSGKDASTRVVVMGSRNIGKSTFCRLLINHLLNSHPCVALLDSDVGQPELTVSGLASISLLRRPLFGPPHMHQRQPDFCHFIGDVSPQNEPQACIQALQSLHSWFCEHGARTDPETGEKLWVPLVVNTHGWIQGMGLEILTEIVRLTAPTHAVMLQSSTARRNLPSSPFWLTQDQPQLQPQIIEIPGIGPLGSATDSFPTSPNRGTRQQDPLAVRLLAAVDARALSWLAFAARCCGADGPPASIDGAAFAAAATCLAAQTPYIVQFSDVKIQALGSFVPASHAAAALNCSIVGLATAEFGNDSDPAQQPLCCLGIGIVRSVDASKGRLFLLTDIPDKQLQLVNVLQAGRLELPPALLQTSELRSPYLGLWSLSAEGSGAGVIKSRNNLARSAQQ